jgi:hypothetical protein
MCLDGVVSYLENEIEVRGFTKYRWAVSRGDLAVHVSFDLNVTIHITITDFGAASLEAVLGFIGAVNGCRWVRAIVVRDKCVDYPLNGGNARIVFSRCLMGLNLPEAVKAILEKSEREDHTLVL